MIPVLAHKKVVAVARSQYVSHFSLSRTPFPLPERGKIAALIIQQGVSYNNRHGAQKTNVCFHTANRLWELELEVQGWIEEDIVFRKQEVNDKVNIHESSAALIPGLDLIAITFTRRQAITRSVLLSPAASACFLIKLSLRS